MSEKQVGRLIYIEPNDIPKETLNTLDGTAKSISNITWNPEDLNIYVDLQVICPKRTDCGNDPFDSGNISNKNDLNERNYISLLEGIKLNKDDKFGSLTTNYTNISYSEILNSSASDREALGISSIDITFDAHFYPRVTINFVDVRGYSLFMPAEEVYETGLRNEAARNEETKDLYESTNRAYSHFFSSVFHFPYPRFILTVKGVYGTKVSFILAVDTFKSSLNSHTGNFDVVITFIGYMYGLYTDIPMTYLLIAPYIEPFSETSDENGLIRSKYWEECGFKSAEDTPLPTFLEFLEKYKTVLLQLSSNQLDLGSETESYNNLQQFVASLDEILKDSEDLFNSVTATTGTQVGSNPIKPYKNNTFSDNVYKLFTKSNEDTTITLEWDKDLASKLYNKIKNTNSTYQRILGTNTISQNFITEFYKKTDGSVDNKMTLSTTLLSVTDKITFATNNTTAELTITSDDKEFLKNLNTIDKNQLGTYYIFGMDIQKTKVKLTKLIEESKNEINQLYSKASENAAEVFEDALGFRISIENIYRMIFAHLQCFFHEYIDNTITKIATDTNVKRHVESDFGISLEDTDIDSKDENPEAPPFFALYEGKDEEKTLAYPGTAVYGRAALETIHEVTLVDKLLNAAKLYRENFDVIRDKIEGLTLELNSGDEDTSFTTNTAAITTFNPIYVYEVLFGDTNPYLHLNNDADIYSILYHAGLRLYIAERLGYIKKYDIRTLTNAAHTDYKTICPDIIEAEVENIVKIFPTLDTRNYTETEFDNIVEDKIFDYGYMYKCISENTSLFMTLATSQLNTMDSSLATDEARRNILNNHKTEFIKYINDNVLYYDDSSVFSKFTNTFNNKIKSKILSPDEAFTSFDSTIEIREGSDSISSNALNKLYEVKENNNKKDTYNGIINQLPTSNLDKYTVPFLVWESDNKLVNMFESPSFQNIEKEVQAFFILLSMVVSELTELITKKRAYDLCDVSIVNNEITYYIHSRCKCLKIRFVTALFFGALEYAYSNLKTKKLFAKYGILIYDGLRYKLNEHLFKHNKNSDIIVRTFKSTLNGENWEHSPLTFDTTYASHPTSECIDKFYSNFLQGDTVLLNLFEENVTTTGDLLNNILNNYVDDIKHNSFEFHKDKYATQLRTGGDSYQEGDFEGMKFLNKGCNTDKNLVDLLTKTCTLIFTDAYTNYSPKSNITDTESFKKYFKKVYIQPILAKLGDMAGEPTDDTETTNNKSSNTKSGDNNDLKKSLYYTLKNLYDKWICSYGNMNRFKLPSTYQEEKNNKEKKYVNGEAVNSISEINNFIFVDAFYRDISNDFLVNPDTLVEIIEQSLSSRQFNFSVYQFMALICEKNKLLFRSLPVYNNFTDTDSLKNIFKPNNLYNHKTPQENNFSPTYLIMYTHQPSAHLNISTKKGINYRDDGFDLAGTIAPKQFESCNDNQHINYKVPAFGVTYGMQNQNYFKSININMDNPITTDYAILNQIQLAERAVSGDLQHPIGIGQNIYSIYSNRSYNCTVEMLGCANIMPMMYFQLNNIPMFKGAYMIVSVKHSIKNGSMTTIFTGVRQSSALQAFTTSNYLLSKIIDTVNSNAGNNTTRNTENRSNRSDNCGIYDLSWADNITL